MDDLFAATSFDQRLAAFVAECNRMAEERHTKAGYKFPRNPIEIMEGGRKYVRVVFMDNGKPQSVYCFVDKTNGNILKADGWKKPHPTPRGSIYASDNGLSAVTAYGAKYIR